MSTYRNEASLTILSLDYVELSVSTEEFGLESDDTLHLFDGE